MTDYLKVFGLNVQQARERRGMTQAQLSKRLDHLSLPYISRVEHGGANLTVKQAVRFAHALGLPLDALFDPKGVA